MDVFRTQFSLFIRVVISVLAFSWVAPSWAGAFIFAGSDFGADVITHPTGYNGSANQQLEVNVCIVPDSPNAMAMRTPVANAIRTFNAQVPTNNNLSTDSNMPSSQFDFESVLLHEVGHCVGLAHPNLSNSSGLSGADQNYTNAIEGANSAFDVNPGTDTIIGSNDDVRGDDINLHWYQKNDNNPFTLPTNNVFDSTTFARDLTDLPAGHLFAANADRDVGVSLGVPNTEAVMQQGTFNNEAQRALQMDDVAMLRLAQSGFDETQGNTDDYTFKLVYQGLSSTDCDLNIDFDSTQTGFAVCQISASFTNGHTVITGANSFFNESSNFFFNEVANAPVTLSVDNSSIDETSGSATVTATLPEAVFETVTVNLAFSGTATNGMDYNPSATSITIPAGNTTGTITLTPTADTNTTEGNETIIVDIDSVSNAVESATNNQVTVTIQDSVEPSVSLSVDNATIAEAAGVATVTATLSAAHTQPVTVNLAFTGAATNGTDYNPSATSIVIPAGDTTGTITLTAVQDSVTEGNEAITVDIDTVTNGNEGTPNQITTTITDDDVSTVTLSVDNANIAEASGVATLTATTDKTNTQVITVNLAFSGTATNGTDYTASATSITIPAGSSSGTATLTATQDTIDELNEDIIVDIATVTNGVEGTPNQTITRITDDDTSTVTLALDNANIAENGGVATVTANLSTTNDRVVTVSLSLSGTATNGADYNPSSTSITIPAGSSSGSITITSVDDNISETQETVIVDINTVTNGAEGTPNQVTTTINDDDTPSVSLSVDNANIAEASGVATITATMDTTSTQPVTVSLAFSGTAANPADYTASGNSITIPAGSTTGTITVTAAQDNVTEGDETIIVDIDNVTGANEGTPNQITTTITDDDVSTVTLSVNNATIAEASGVATLTATTDKTNTQTIIVTLAFSGAATNGTDYTASATSITIPVGSTSGTATLTATQDTIDELNEGIIVDIANVINGTEGAPNQITTTITDDDTSTVTLSIDNTSIAENGGVATVTATTDTTNSQAITVTLGFTGTAANGTDYNPSATTINIPAGSSSGTMTITGVDDNVAETQETVIVDIASVANGVEGTPNQVTTTINDDDTPSVTLSVDNATIAEAAGVATVTATMDKTSTQVVTVNLAFTGVAINGTDYNPSATSINIPAGSTTGSITLTATQDNITEGNEAITVDIASVSGANEGTPNQITTTITDDDVSTVTLSVNNANIAEASGVATVTATTDKTNTQNITVNLAFSGAATNGTDYTASATSITIPAGSTSGTITLTATQDVIVEGDEAIVVDIATVTNATAGTPNQITTSITDDDVSTVTLSINNTNIAENGGVATVTATTDKTNTQTITVNLAFSGTATNGTDYNPSATSITIPAGNTSGTMTITSVDDTADEPAETVIVDIVSVTNGVAGTPNQVTTSITDDDTPNVTLSVNNATIAEAAGTATVTATLSTPASQTVTVNLALSGTATNNTDYTASGTSIVIPAGNTTGTATITATQDAVVEGNETVIVDIASVTNANEGTPNQITTTITDDDVSTVTLSVDNTSIAEASGSATVTASIDKTNTQDVTINLTFTGTATNGTDYNPSAASITIPAGNTTGTITVTAIQDAIAEGNETAIVSINTATNASTGTPADVTITIADDEINNVTLSTDNTDLAEASGSATITATLSSANSQTVTVSLDFSGTATNGTDYNASAATISIPTGNTTGTITLTAIQDTLTEGDETLVVSIASTTNTSAGAPSTVNLQIIDDDEPPKLSVNDATLTEGNSGSVNMTFTVTLDVTTTDSIAVNYETADNTATAADNDYFETSGRLIFAPGERSKTLTVGVVGDQNIEQNETFTLRLRQPENATIDDGEGQGSILNDDFADFGDAPASYGTLLADDGARHIVAGVLLGSERDNEINGQPNATADGDDTTGLVDDEDGLNITNLIAGSNTNLSIAASDVGFLNAWVDFNADGDFADNNEQILTNVSVQAGANTINITTPLNATIGNTYARFRVASSSGLGPIGAALDGEVEDYAITISNPDSPTVNLSLDNASLNEAEANQAGGVATLTATLTSAFNQDVAVTLALSGSASNNSDYTLSSTTFTIPSGELSNTITLNVINDNDIEPLETVVIDIDNVTNATAGAASQLNLNINDDDALASGIQMDIADAQTFEGNTLQFTVTLNQTSPLTVTAQFASRDGTATAAGLDYQPVSGTLSFAPGEQQKTITVATQADTLIENTENLFVTLSNIVNANAGDSEGQGNILDTSTPVTVSVADATTLEGNKGSTPLNFSVQLSRVTQNDVVVQYQTLTGSAQVGSDYVGINDTLVIPTGQTQANISIEILGDTQFEADEQFQLILNSAQNANIADNQAIGTITNDDVATTDIALALTVNPNLSVLNQTTTWAFTTTHRNGEAATDVELRAFIIGTNLNLTLPNNCTQDSPANNATDVRCQLGNLAPNQTTTTELQVSSATVQNIYLAASVNVQPADINRSNNRLFRSLTITPRLFNTPRPSIGSFVCRDVASGDMNNDGAVDLIAATGSPTQIFFNDGAGGFSNTPITLSDNPESYGITVADFNQDGLDDFALANDGVNQIYLNQGTTSTTERFQIISLPRTNNSRAVVATDIDNDSDLDLVFANLAAPDTIWLNDGAGQFTHFADLSSADSVDVTAADLNGDNAPELLFAQPDIAQSLWLNDGTGVMTLSAQTTGPASAVALLALNGDNQIDAVIAQVAQNTDNDDVTDDIPPQVNILHNNAGQLSVVQSVSRSSVTDIELADFDQDGQMDLLLETDNAANNIYFGTANGQFNAFSTTLDANGVEAHVVDLDKNTQPDVVFALGQDIGLSLFYNKNAAFGQQVVQANIQRGSGNVGWLTLGLLLVLCSLAYGPLKRPNRLRQTLFGIMGVALLLGATPKVYADTVSNWSVGLLGQVLTGHAQGSDLNFDLLEQNGHENVQADVDKEALAGELFLHYRFANSPFGLELSLFDSGEYQSSITAQTNRPAQLLEDFAAVHPRSGQGIALGVRGDAAIGRGFAAHIKLGLAYWRGEFELRSEQMRREFTDSGTMFIFRSGIQYQLNPSWALASTVGLENYPDHNIYHLDLGVIWLIPSAE